MRETPLSSAFDWFIVGAAATCGAGPGKNRRCRKRESAQRESAQRESARDATAATLVRLMAARLDSKLWVVRYEPQFDLIEVQSRAPALIEPEPVISGPAFDERQPTERNFGFSLRVQPLLLPADHARLNAANAAILAQLKRMAAQMKDIGGKGDSFLPRGGAQTERVNAYNRLKAALRPLPQFRFRDISLAVAYYDWQPFGRATLLDASDGSQASEQPQWQRQQKTAALAVAKLLIPYQSAK